MFVYSFFLSDRTHSKCTKKQNKKSVTRNIYDLKFVVQKLNSHKENSENQTKHKHRI